MTTERVVLITGAAGYWGERLARRLLAEPTYHVIGLDQERPDTPPPHLDFIQASLHDPLLPDLLSLEKVDTVLHLAPQEIETGYQAAYEHNVMGTTKLFKACATAGVQHIVVKSSTSVYGSHADNAAHLTETHPLRGRGSGNGHLLEIEFFCNGFRRQQPQLGITVLRFAPILGPTADTPLTRYLGERAAPTLLGFNPMMQLIHEEDVVEALAQAVAVRPDGVVNVAAEPPMPLMRLLALAGVLPLPLPPMLAGRLLRRLGLESDFLRYRCTVDTGRMGSELDFSPSYSAEETVHAFRERPRSASGPASQFMNYKAPMPLHMIIEARRRARATEGTS